MMHQLAHLAGKNLSMGIDAETASVGELTPRQLSIAATTAFNRGVEVGLVEAPCSFASSAPYSVTGLSLDARQLQTG